MIIPQTVLVTGGAGYVGSALVPKLLTAGHRVKVLDLYLFGDGILSAVADHPNLEQVKGDLRDRRLLERVLPGCDAVIHLACISNDPSFELDPELSKSINYDSFFGLVDVSKDSGVRRFIYASSSSVYGIKDEENVTEELSLQPLTDYSKYKALCEEVLLKKRAAGFTTIILRPATVCGYAPRLRLDLAVNILTNHAITNRLIKVFGGQQKRPNIHIEDMTDLYVASLRWPEARSMGRSTMPAITTSGSWRSPSACVTSSVLTCRSSPRRRMITAPTISPRTKSDASSVSRHTAPSRMPCGIFRRPSWPAKSLTRWPTIATSILNVCRMHTCGKTAR
jgi:nucleoside-diphosphate-sugar epimerase